MGYKKFHNCNATAYYGTAEINHYNEPYAIGKTEVLDNVYSLQSYNSNVVSMRREYNNDLECVEWKIWLAPRFEYSATTKRQVTRFIKEVIEHNNDNSVYLSIADLRKGGIIYINDNLIVTIELICSLWF